MKRKILSIALSLALVISMIPVTSVTAFASDTAPNYLTFTAQENNSSVTFNYWKGTDVQYKLGSSDAWIGCPKGTTINLDKDEYVQLKGSGVETSYGAHFSMTGSVKASGSVTSLTDGVGNDANVTLTDYCYEGMFNGCTGLITAPELPAVKLSRGCYCCMFYGCTNLEIAPEELPATELTYNCYYSMFQDCKSLKNAPNLPATSLSGYCYCDMFFGCSSLLKAPDLPATELTEHCYEGMFIDCISLKSAPEILATSLDECSCCEMFMGCSNLLTLPRLTATKVDTYSYNYMFTGCTNLCISECSDNWHKKEWSIPSEAESTSGSAWSWNSYMFQNTGGSFEGNPEVGKTYYILDEARIGENSYATVADAIAAAKDGDTISLNYTCYANALSTNKRVTIKLNDYELKKSALDPEKRDLIAADTKMIDNKDGTITLVPVADAYNYAAEGNKITATSKGEGGFTVSIGITAKNQIFNGKPYTGAALDSEEWAAAGLEVPTIMYVGRCGTKYAASENAPARLGKYTAYITVGDKTAKADFEIMTKAAFDRQQAQINLSKRIKERISLIEKHFAELHKSLGTWYSFLLLFNR